MLLIYVLHALKHRFMLDTDILTIVDRMLHCTHLCTAGAEVHCFMLDFDILAIVHRMLHYTYYI